MFFHFFCICLFNTKYTKKYKTYKYKTLHIINMTSNMYYFNGCGDKDLYKKCNTFEELCYVKIY